jgi:phenylalanyl-tRNA synthetase alpha chain
MSLSSEIKGIENNIGHLHPLTHIIQHTASIFSELGFSVVSGPHIENEYYNFDALNILEHHPARDMWDTFWLKPENSKRLLRTHTSPVQVRFAESHKPPIRIIVPGKTFRYEATDSTHEAQFFQLEGLYIDEQVSLANLKYVLEYYFERLFNAKTPIRFRPSYFPFVEPGVEIDMTCFKCSGSAKDCSTCKQTGWIEIMGAGMVHPKVLQNMGVNPRKYSGFAFGGGIDRLAMLKYGIADIRSLYHRDLRLTNQF